jgi:hypothetical protein
LGGGFVGCYWRGKPIYFEKITIVELNELSHWSKMLSTPELVMNLDVRRIPVI